MKCASIFFIFFLLIGESFSQPPAPGLQTQGLINLNHERTGHTLRQYQAATRLLDAALNSLNSINALIRKESYRNKISAFNNPTSSGLGFSLDAEIQAAIKPLLSKAKNVNREKFAQVISSVLSSPARVAGFQPALASSTVFNTLVSLIGNLTVQEKRVTREDLDSFVVLTGKYFRQYEKLNAANSSFDQNIERLADRVEDLQFDIREYATDLVTVVHQGIPRGALNETTLEELLLKYLDPLMLEALFPDTAHLANRRKIHFPADALKGAKELAYDLQKLFNDYQKTYSENYQEIRAILLLSKTLGKSVNVKQVDQSLAELEVLFTDSGQADNLNLRLTTLRERLNYLVQTELRPL